MLHIVGVGPGKPELLTGKARSIIDSCRYVAAGRHLLQLAPATAETFAIGSDLEAVRDFISESLKAGDVCVLSSGDPGCYSILPFMMEYFEDEILVEPGVSSMQILAARLGISWQDWTLNSLHGRGKAIRVQPQRTKALFFCDRDNTPQDIARLLLEEMKDCAAVAGSDLGLEGEEIIQGTLLDIASSSFPGNSLLLVIPDESASDPQVHEHQESMVQPGEAGKPGQGGQPGKALQPGQVAAAPGIPDGLWLRHEGIPLSKSEVRAVLLSKARPVGRDVIWDVGAGTGSYGIECSLLEPRARVFSIDKNPQAGRLVRENAAMFGARVETVEGFAPDVFSGLPRPDLVIVGGNDGRLAEIFSAAQKLLNPGGRIIVTALLEETKKAAHKVFAESGLSNREAVRISIARGEERHWKEQNPVIIFTGDKDMDK